MRHNLRDFLTREDGAVTIDWVVLTAGLVGIGNAILTAIGTATNDLATEMDKKIDGISVRSQGGQ